MGDDRVGAAARGVAPGTAVDIARQTVSPGPLVSVIVAAYNAERFLGRALRSALAQTYRHLEIIVVDDGSTDRTAEVIRSFADTRIRHLSQPNRGQGAARNLGTRSSAGRYVTFLDADDIYLPQKIERQVEFLRVRPDCEIVFCDALHFYSRQPRRLLVRRSHPGHEDMLRELVRASFINPNTLMIAGDTLRGGFWFREERYYPEEWDLCLRLARAGRRFAYQPEGLVIVEIREDSNTTMAAQFPLKRHTLEMFEQFFAGMTAEERATYGADAVLRSCRQRLAWASLVSADPVRAVETTAGTVPWAFAMILRGFVRFVPTALMRATVAAVWRLRQRLSFTRMPSVAVEQVWGSVGGHG